MIEQYGGLELFKLEIFKDACAIVQKIIDNDLDFKIMLNDYKDINDIKSFKSQKLEYKSR